MAVTRSYDSQRLYVRVRAEQKNIKKSARSSINLLSIPYRQLKAQAEEIVRPILNLQHYVYIITLLIYIML